MSKFSLKLVILFLSFLFAAACNFWQSSPALANSHPIEIASLFSFSGKQPTNLGVKEGKLAECLPSPNCVSSQSTDAIHKIAPLTYNSLPEEAFSKLKKIIQSQKNAKIVTETENYLYAQFTSQIMGFVDDVEFYLDKDAGVIQVRSASRLGESDLGVNRRRIEKIRSQFSA